MKIVHSRAALVPNLACARTSRGRYDILSGFHAFDRLHIIEPLHGYDRGTILNVLGYYLAFDDRGETYEVRAYVTGYGTTYAGREAERFPVDKQQEEWFGTPPDFFTEIDMTDWAHAIRLERLHEAVVIPMYPKGEEHIRRAA